MALRDGRGGSDLISAVVGGGNLICPMALATSRTGPWFHSSTAGTLGAAAAGIILGLAPLRMRNALGPALCLASGTTQAITQGTLAKRMLAAFAARNGLEAALLAAAGIDGPREVFTGDSGYFEAFHPGDLSVLEDDLGQRFETDCTGLKKYPSCTCNHALILACQNLMATRPLAVERIRRVTARVTPFTMRILGAPFDATTSPSSDGAVQRPTLDRMHAAERRLPAGEPVRTAGAVAAHRRTDAAD